MKKMKGLKIFGIIVMSIVLLWTVFGLIPPKKVLAENNFLKGDSEYPLIAAHRGGGELMPENTLSAFDNCIQYNVSMLETDIWMTEDGVLVISHDETVKRMSDCEKFSSRIISSYYKIKNLTLDELQHLNFGYNFKDDNGNYPYRFEDVENASWEERKTLMTTTYKKYSILTVEDFFKAYANVTTNLGTKYIFGVEIKDSDERGMEAADKLYELMLEYDVLDRVVVGTFNSEVEEYIQNNSSFSGVIQGASIKSAATYIVTQFLGVNIFYGPKFQCLQIPTGYDLNSDDKDDLILDVKTVIRRAHRANISVQYWTINEEEEMKELIKLGCDIIMTDKPDVLYRVIEELKNN